jgi:hypothetical protein
MHRIPLFRRRAVALAALKTPLMLPLPLTCTRQYQQATSQSRIERQVEQGAAAAAGAGPGGAAPGAGMPTDAQLQAAIAGVDPARIDKVAIWGLWNEGNLFSMSVPELAAFLQKEGVAPKAPRKSALVRQVEELMQAYSPPQVKPTDDTVASVTAQMATNATEYAAGQTDVFDEADEYGDWGADPAFEDKRGVDFMALAPSRGGQRGQDKMAHLGSHAFQLLHEQASGDIALGQFSAAKLPGCAGLAEAYSPVNIASNDANRLAFRRAFQWSTHSLWNLGLDGEINIGAGKALYKRAVAKRNRSVLPVWTCQEHLNTAHPFAWFAVAHDTNVPVIEKLAADMGMKLGNETPETSFKLTIVRQRDILDVELNADLAPALVNKPWERIYVCHYLRDRLPDLRYLVRARRPMKKKVAEAYLDARMIQLTNDTAQSVLSPELGDVVYCCERKRRRWTSTLDSGVTLSVLETRRTPLIVQKQGDDGERLEYELIANIPQQVEQTDLHALADDLWARGNQMATLLEEGLGELQAHTMSSAAAFEVAPARQA